MESFFQCPGCSQRYVYAEALAGKTVRCKKCGQSLLIQAPSASAGPSDSGPGQRAGVAGSPLDQLLEESLGGSLPGASAPWAAGAPPAAGSPSVIGSSLGPEWPAERRNPLDFRGKLALAVGVSLGIIGLVELMVFPLAGVPLRILPVVAVLFGLAIAALILVELNDHRPVGVSVAAGIVALLLAGSLIAPRGNGGRQAAAGPAAPPIPRDAGRAPTPPIGQQPPAPGRAPARFQEGPGLSRGRPTDLAGGPTGVPFQLVGSGEAVLGFRYFLGEWAGEQAVAILEPLYRRETAPGLACVVAREGYAVGAIDVETGNLVHAVRVVFMRLKPDGQLDPSDSYKSDWIGASADGPAKTLGGDGKKVIGVHGRRGAVLDAVGLVLE